jgi:hypothetical protein
MQSSQRKKKKGKREEEAASHACWMTVLLSNNGNSFHCVYTRSVTTCFSSIFFLLFLVFSSFPCWICCQLAPPRGFRAWEALLYDKSQAGGKWKRGGGKPRCNWNEKKINK